MRSLLLFLFASSCIACTTTFLPPPPPPARELPPQEEPLPTDSESGLSRVVITTDVPARVERFAHLETIHHSGTWRTTTGVGKELLCAETPCTVSLPYGDHELSFAGIADRERTSTTRISIRRATTVINHTLGRVHGNPVRILGGLVLVTGLVMIGVAAALAADATKHHQATPTSAAPVAMAGLGSTMVGGLIIGLTPTKVQEGATTQWTPSRPIDGATVTAGLRF